MADAKITLKTVTDDEGLKKLNAALADGQQSVMTMKAQLQALKKETQNGTQATEEQSAAMHNLFQRINEITQNNKQLTSAINKTRQSLVDTATSADTASKSMTNLNSRMVAVSQSTNSLSISANSITQAFSVSGQAMIGAISGTGILAGMTAALSEKLLSLATNIASTVVSAIADLTEALIEAGAQTEQVVAKFEAMRTTNETGEVLHETLDNLTRDLTYSAQGVQAMYVQMINLGMSSTQAADTIRLCADAAAGMNQGEQVAVSLANAMAKIAVGGTLEREQLVNLQIAGINLNEAFKSLGMNAEQVMQGLRDGTIKNQDAINALTSYLHKFDGAMAESKNNVIDKWGDTTGNLKTAMGELGMAIADAFNQSGIVDALVSITQSFIDIIRGDGVGAFAVFGTIAQAWLNVIGDALSLVGTVIEGVVVVAYTIGDAFNEACNEAMDALGPIPGALSSIYDWCVSVINALNGVIQKAAEAIHAEFKAKTAKNHNADDGSNAPLDSYSDLAVTMPTEHGWTPSRPAIATPSGGGGGGRSGGGGGGGGRTIDKAAQEEQRAIDSLIKKYADAETQKEKLADLTLKTAQAAVTMMSTEEQAVESQRLKIEALNEAHDKVIAGYEKELETAQKITDADTRTKTIEAINEQIEAENRLLEVKKQAQIFQDNLKVNQENSKNIMDSIIGNPDEYTQAINIIKEQLSTAMTDIDTAMSQPDEEQALTGIAQILGTDPETLAEEMATKGQTLAEFVNQYKEGLAEAAQAEITQEQQTKQWHDYVKSYAEDVGKSMGNAMYDFITGAKSASQALGEFVSNLLKNALKILTQWLAMYAIYSAFPYFYKAYSPADLASETVFGIKAQHKAQGGLISGPGGCIHQ